MLRVLRLFKASMSINKTRNVELITPRCSSHDQCFHFELIVLHQSESRSMEFHQLFDYYGLGEKVLEYLPLCDIKKLRLTKKVIKSTCDEHIKNTKKLRLGLNN